MTTRCTCGKSVNTGWSAGNGWNHARCLLCETRDLMRTFRDPMTMKYRARVKRKKATP